MKKYRKDFQIFENNKDLIYLDYASTTFMPQNVIKTWTNYHEYIGCSINRGSGVLSKKAQIEYIESKKKILSFFSANNDYEIIFGKNATECLNILAFSAGEILKEGDIVIMGPFEHHSNILPWKKIIKNKKACLVQLPILESGEIDYDFLYKLEISKIKIISISLISNITCNEFNIDKLKDYIKNTKAFTILDVSQSVAHRKLSFSDINADAYVMSAHKMYGPKNIGAAFVKKNKINELEPLLLGGGMVWNSLGNNPKWHKGARKFEAGTLDVGLIKAWSESCNYLDNIGFENIINSDTKIWNYVKYSFKKENIEILPGGNNNSFICSFKIKDKHPHDLIEIFEKNFLEIRIGHMCSQNTLDNFGKDSVFRISWGIGSDIEDIDEFLKILKEIL